MTRLWNNGPALLALCMLFWGGSVITGRAAAAQIPPATFTALRWGGALLIAAPFAWGHLRRDWPRLRPRWWVPALLAAFGVVTYNTLVYRGLHDTTAVNALLLNSAVPLVILVAAFVLFGERPRGRQAAAIGVSVVGVAVIAAEGSWQTLRHLRFNAGDALVLLAVVSYALYACVLRLRPAVHPLSLLTASIAIGVAALGPMAGLELWGGARLVVTPLSVGCLLYAAVFPAFLSYLLFNRGVELIGAARAGQFMHLMPAFGIVLAVVLLGERLHGFHAVGMGLIGAGLWLAQERDGIKRDGLKRPSRPA